MIISCFKNIIRSGMRSVLTVLGISVGVASVVIIGFIGQTGINTVNREMDSLGVKGLAVSMSGSDKDVFLDNSDCDYIKQLDFVDSASPVISEFSFISSGDKKEQVIMWGTESCEKSMISASVVSGSDFSSEDIEQCRNICLISERLEYRLYKDGSALGKQISVMINDAGFLFTVTGTVKTESGLVENVVGEYVPEFIYIPYSSVQRLRGDTELSQLNVNISKSTDPDSAAEKITGMLNLRKNTDGVKASNLTKQRDKLSGIMNSVSDILTAIAGISLVISAIGIMTMMLVSVNERTNEIGIKKSLGATKVRILTEFLTEGLTICFIGAIIGIIIGVMLTYLATVIFNIEFSLSPKYMLGGGLFALVFGGVFGLYPAAKAANMQPAAALRTKN